MTKFFIRSLLSICLLFTVLNAEQNERNGGPYIGFGYGEASYNDDGYFSDVKDSRSASYNLYAGAYINRFLSVELGYMKSGDFSAVDLSSIQTSVNYSSITVNALVHYPVLDDSLDFYAKFGAGQSYVSLSNSDGAALVYGAGMSYRFNGTYALRIAYDMYKFAYDSDTRGRFNMNMQYVYAGIEVQF
ncbi:porin family protein [Sulfurimonas sp. HSL-1716]|uniref:porin family protein n=1 Tax=Hydrocurvibacter sulfurireducens TaxID=3131937 RepID=UPI0031F7B40D